jgi:hypothetical protein
MPGRFFGLRGLGESLHQFLMLALMIDMATSGFNQIQYDLTSTDATISC